MPTDTFTIAATADNTSSFWAANPISGSPSGSNGVQCWATRSPGPDNNVCCMRWSTSSIPDGATITAVTLRLWCVSKTGSSFSLVGGYYPTWGGGNLTSTDAIDEPSPSIFTARTIASFTTAAFNDIALTDLTGINKTGYTAIRMTMQAGSPAGTNELRFEGYNESTHPPQLLVTYTDPSFAAPLVVFNPPLIDDINRADSSGAGLGTASIGGVGQGWTWPAAIRPSHNPMNIVSNAAASVDANAHGCYTSLLFGPDVDVGMKIKTVAAVNNIGLWSAITEPFTAGVDCYFHYWRGDTNLIVLNRYNDNAAATIAQFAATLASGDSFGYQQRVLPDRVTFHVYTRAGAGAWTYLGSADDTSATRLTGAGAIGLSMVTSTTWAIEEVYCRTAEPYVVKQDLSKFPKPQLRRA